MDDDKFVKGIGILGVVLMMAAFIWMSHRAMTAEESLRECRSLLKYLSEKAEKKGN